ncbi:MAG: hypothetical protein AB1488_06700 [Nitrospirota bacterium]
MKEYVESYRKIDDYLSIHEKKPLNLLTEEIKSLYQQYNLLLYRSRINLVELGIRIIVAKNKMAIEGGNFKRWLEEEVGITVQTGYRIMNAAERSIEENSENILEEIGYTRYSLLDHLTAEEKRIFLDSEHVVVSSGIVKKGKDLNRAELKEVIKEGQGMPYNSTGNGQHIKVKDNKVMRDDEKDKKIEELSWIIAERNDEVNGYKNELKIKTDKIKDYEKNMEEQIEKLVAVFQREKDGLVNQISELQKIINKKDAELTRRLNGTSYPPDYEKVKNHLKTAIERNKSLEIIDRYRHIHVLFDDVHDKLSKVKYLLGEKKIKVEGLKRFKDEIKRIIDFCTDIDVSIDSLLKIQSERISERI